MVRFEGDDEHGEGETIDLEARGMGPHRDEVARQVRKRGGVDRTREKLVPLDVDGRARADPVCDGPDAVREAVREAHRADEDHACERDRPRRRARSPREARREPQDRARHASSVRRMVGTGINVRRRSAEVWYRSGKVPTQPR